ncbi:hypothetical protein MNBD_BACTEROID03-419 [hydrothermal vent metagenome]|uniref:Uncharacterized protein n=1 Tax=hydrothermal vent metagenome TaxID=652676 RepID=A0A3B0T4C2_9ZZZZ
MRKIFFLSMVFILPLNCSDNDNDDKTDCSNMACTEIFLSISVTVKDSSGSVISLGRFEVTDLTTGEDLTKEVTEGELETFRQNGIYPLYDDLFVAENQNTTRNIVFKGFINNKEVVNAEYTVGTDCCHVSLVSGDSDITID